MFPPVFFRRRLLLLFAAFAATTMVAVGQSVTDPHITSWVTTNSAKYARVWETSSDKSSGNAVSTWPRSGLTNGGGGQSTPAYSEIQRVAYSNNYVYIYTTGLPGYVMGNWLTPNGGVYTSWPKNRGAIHRIPRNPSIPTTKQKTNGSGGVLVNGVFVWANGDAQSYSTTTATVSMSGSGIWNRLAGVAEAFNFDTSYGHQPSSGAYHNHINPIALRYQLGDAVNYNATTKVYSEGTPTAHSPLIGWANDGLPIYGPYGYSSAMDATSGVRRMTSGFQKRDGTNGTTNLATTGRHSLPKWAAEVQGKGTAETALASSEYGPNTSTTYQVGGGVTSTYSIGLFAEDYDYLGDLGKTQGVDFDLNRQNVRYCVTPEYPGGTYAYFVCIDSAGNTQFPDLINQEFFGSAPMGQGTVTSISESVTEYADRGPAAAITLTGTAAGGSVNLQWNSAEGATYLVESSPNNIAWTTLSSSVASGGLATSYTAPTAIFYRVTLNSIATYDASGTYGTPTGKTTTLQYGVIVTPPSITTQPTNVTVGAGTSATFTVVASGSAALAYQWAKDLVPIGGATSASYTIATTTSGDAGSYTCTVTNTAGSATSNAAMLVVNVPVVPSVTTQPASLGVVSGASATFSVAASGTATLSYQWQKDGNPIGGATSTTYSIAITSASDAGSYTCVVTNSAGSVTSNAAVLTVDTSIPPTITTQPASTTAASGGSATFTVAASGSAPFSYQWQKAGSPIGGATSATFTLLTVQAADAGAYTCVVTNGAGSATSSAATLTVTLPVAPSITFHPMSITAFVGASATFSVTASGTAPLHYEWQKSGVPIAGAASATYSIPVTQAGDAGSYACLVTNIAGSAISNTATLALNVATAPVILTQPVAVSVTAGGSATFTVSAVGTNPLSYQWRKNGTAIPGATAASYTIASAQAADVGNYSCAVSNSLGSATSNAVALIVATAPVAPVITAQPANAVVLAGGSAAFAVSASGTAPLSYQWTKNGTAISGATSASYSIVGAQAADAGSYACIVTNAAGSAPSSAATLTITSLTLPVVSSGSATSAAVTSGGQTTFSVTATGAGPFTYQWARNGVPVTGALSSTLAIDNVQPATAGVYRATIYSAVGSTASDPFILGVASTSKVLGLGTEIGANIQHTNGNIYDQVSLDGAAATVTADGGQVVRLSFVDLTDDIVQVEFSGAGTLTVVLDNPSGPAPAVKYNQPGVVYMKGHAGLTIVGANETTNLSIFSVGRVTAVNQALFRPGEVYDGVADVAFVAIASLSGKFGGLRAANASFSNTRGITGVYAPGVAFGGPVYVGDISGFNTAAAMFVLGAGSDVRVTGGDLAQGNLQPVAVKGVTQLRFVDGSTSHGAVLPAQRNRARLEQDGVNVTDQIVVNPPTP